MTPREPAVGSGQGGRGLGCFLGAVALVFFFFLMMAGIGGGLLELGWALVFGWTGFLSRVLPKVSWDWGAIVTAVVFTALTGILAHYFLAWLTRAIAVARGTSLRWQRKWTLCGLFLCAFCLLVGMSVAGAVHQLGWMFSSNESLFENRYAIYRFVEINQVEMAIREALLDTNTLPGLRKDVPASLASSEPGRGASLLESVRMLVSLSSSNTVDGVLILPRDKRIGTRYGTRYGPRYVTGDNSAPVSQDDAQRFIQTNAANLVAF